MTEKKHETFLKFPCEFNLKVMGHNNEDFEVAVLTIFRRKRIKLSENALNTKVSKNKKYLSLTITFTAKSKKQLDNLYRALHNCKKVLMTL